MENLDPNSVYLTEEEGEYIIYRREAYDIVLEMSTDLSRKEIINKELIHETKRRYGIWSKKKSNLLQCIYVYNIIN